MSRRRILKVVSSFGILGYVVNRSRYLISHSEEEEKVNSSSLFTEDDMESWRRYKLLRPDVASRTEPARIKSFLSKQDIQDLQRVIEEEGKDLPTVKRDELGRRIDFGGDKDRVAWKAAYLHCGLWARDRIPQILDNVLNAARKSSIQRMECS